MRFLRAYCSTIWHFVFCNGVTHRHLSQSCSSSIHNIMTVYRWITLLRLLYLRFHTYMLIIASVHCPNLSMWDVLNSADMITPARKTQLSFQRRRTSCHKSQNFDNSIHIIITGSHHLIWMPYIVVYSLGYSVWLNWLIRITMPLLSLCWLLKTCLYSFPNYSWLVMYIRIPVCKIVLLNLFMYIASTQSVLWSPSDGYFRSSPFVIFNSSLAVILLLSDLFHSAVCNHITCLLFRINSVQLCACNFLFL